MEAIRKRKEELLIKRAEELERFRMEEGERAKEREQENLRILLRDSQDSIYQGGNKLRLCLHCNKVGIAMRFDPYTFYNHSQNLGCCKQCKKDGVPRTIE